MLANTSFLRRWRGTVPFQAGRLLHIRRSCRICFRLAKVTIRVINRSTTATILIVALIGKVLSIRILSRLLPVATGVRGLSSLRTPARMLLGPQRPSTRPLLIPGAPVIARTVSKVLPRHQGVPENHPRRTAVQEVAAAAPLQVLAPPQTTRALTSAQRHLHLTNRPPHHANNPLHPLPHPRLRLMVRLLYASRHRSLRATSLLLRRGCREMTAIWLRCSNLPQAFVAVASRVACVGHCPSTLARHCEKRTRMRRRARLARRDGRLRWAQAAALVPQL